MTGVQASLVRRLEETVLKTAMRFARAATLATASAGPLPVMAKSVRAIRTNSEFALIGGRVGRQRPRPLPRGCVRKRTCAGAASRRFTATRQPVLPPFPGRS